MTDHGAKIGREIKKCEKLLYILRYKKKISNFYDVRWFLIFKRFYQSSGNRQMKFHITLPRTERFSISKNMKGKQELNDIIYICHTYHSVS